MCHLLKQFESCLTTTAVFADLNLRLVVRRTVDIFHSNVETGRQRAAAHRESPLRETACSDNYVEDDRVHMHGNAETGRQGTAARDSSYFSSQFGHQRSVVQNKLTFKLSCVTKVAINATINYA